MLVKLYVCILIPYHISLPLIQDINVSAVMESCTLEARQRSLSEILRVRPHVQDWPRSINNAYLAAGIGLHVRCVQS